MWASSIDLVVLSFSIDSYLVSSLIGKIFSKNVASLDFHNCADKQVRHSRSYHQESISDTMKSIP
jgi:hypothetical protein